MASSSLIPTKLDYFDDMWKLQSKATVLSLSKGEDGRTALVLDRTIFHPQGGGQPADTGFIAVADSCLKFVAEDVRSKDGIVYHYGFVENSVEEMESKFEKGKEVFLRVDEARRKLNSRLHSAGHLLDACMRNVGLGDLEPTKGYHFPQGPYVEYKGTVPQKDMESKQKELELEANALISRGGKVNSWPGINMLWCSDEVKIFMRLVPMDVNYNISKFELHWTSIAYPTNPACYHSSGNPNLASFYLICVILILLVTITLGNKNLP